MSTLSACLALLIVVDPIGASGAIAPLSAANGDQGWRSRIGVIAVVASAGLLVVAALLAEPFLDLFDVSAPDAAVAAGVLVCIPAFTRVVFGRAERLLPADVSTAPAWRTALVPVAMPVIAGPAALAVVVALHALHGLGVALAAVVVATLGLAFGLFAGRSTDSPSRLRRTAVRVIGIAMLVVAVALAYDGIFVA